MLTVVLLDDDEGFRREMADGVDVLTTVRDLWPRVGRILVTGFGNALGREGLPAHAIMLKPCDLGAMRELLRMLPILTVPPGPLLTSHG